MASAFDGFTNNAKRVMEAAKKAAMELGHNYIGTEHILLGLVSEEGAAGRLLRGVGISVQDVVQAIIAVTGKGDHHFTEAFGLTPRSKKVIEQARVEAREHKVNYVGTEHILLALLSESEGVAAHILRGEMDMDPAQMYKDLGNIIDRSPSKNSGGEGEKGEASSPFLKRFGRDLTQEAREGRLDPMIGRGEEIERVLQILSRRTKNNPVLIGEPGVGKSAVVEGLAQRIVEGNIPELLKSKRIIAVDIGGMLAGAKYRGEFEERLKGTLDELKELKDCVMFIDELHTVMGAGASGEGAIDAANMLKPALARGELQCIGATTLDEYHKHIEKDAALERRFQPVLVGEPSLDESVEILKGLRDKYEAHHKVKITDEAIQAAVTLSHRYISDRFLPDKAIDLVDEACSRVRLHSYTTPLDMKQDEARLEQLNKDKEEAVAHQRYEEAAKVRDEEQQLKKQMEEKRKVWESGVSAMQNSIGEDEIAQIVSLWTHVPVTKLTQTESERLLQMESILHNRVVGQDEAVKAVARAVRRARAGLKDAKRPIGSFIFLGPTGVGKTELCKALAEAMFGDEDALVRVDMSEYMEKHTVSRMIGSPPGYVGYSEGGQLTEAVRRKPYCVLLFDEIEKAHQDVFNIFLQILEDGRLTDGSGRVVDFKNTIVVMTSNVGASEIKKARGLGFAAGDESIQGYERMKEAMLDELKRAFRPEFLNRVDELIVFHQLDEKDIHAIADMMLRTVAKRLKERGIELSWAQEVPEYLAKEGFDPAYGARPLRRAIQNTVEDALSEEILAGRLGLKDAVRVRVDDGKLAFDKADKADTAAAPEEEASTQEGSTKE